MLTYVARRVGWALVELLVVLAITFLLAYLIPGDPARTIAGPHASIATVDAIRRQLGLNQPLPVQFGTYLAHVAEGNLGTSIEFQTPVLGLLWQRFPATLLLTVAALTFEILLGVPLGVLAAVRPHSWWDRVSDAVVLAGMAAPAFWVGIVLLFLFGFQLRWLPLGGYGPPVLLHLILPAVTLGIGGAAYYARVLRGRILEVGGEPFIRVAAAKGLSPSQVLWRHVRPNILPTLVSQMGMDFGFFMSGVVVVEAVFGWPGIGWQAWNAIQALDIPLILGTVLFAATWVIAMNLVVDVLYAYLDPRIRVGGRQTAA